MAAEYSFVPVQTIDVDENVTFMNGSRACHKGYIQHRDDSGIFFLKGSNNGCRAVYRVTFDGNIAVAPAVDGGVVGPISVAITINGEALGNATATVTPTVIGAFFNVSITTFIEIPCGCCVTVGVENVSEGVAAAAGSAIDVANANIIFDRVA
ncbi:MAG: hypothetical protein J6R52_03710 [Alphaproteobacteria bacterium]|nr:hypothetical protein [Alphaproteobacteria bacterium]